MSHLREDVQQQKRDFNAKVDKVIAEFKQTREAWEIREADIIKEVREEAAREHFEQEKADFLLAIQENMQMLDNMLK